MPYSVVATEAHRSVMGIVAVIALVSHSSVAILRRHFADDVTGLGSVHHDVSVPWCGRARSSESRSDGSKGDG